MLKVNYFGFLSSHIKYHNNVLKAFNNVPVFIMDKNGITFSFLLQNINILFIKYPPVFFIQKASNNLFLKSLLNFLVLVMFLYKIVQVSMKFLEKLTKEFLLKIFPQDLCFMETLVIYLFNFFAFIFYKVDVSCIVFLFFFKLIYNFVLFFKRSVFVGVNKSLVESTKLFNLNGPLNKFFSVLFIKKLYSKSYFEYMRGVYKNKRISLFYSGFFTYILNGLIVIRLLSNSILLFFKENLEKISSLKSSISFLNYSFFLLFEFFFVFKKLLKIFIKKTRTAQYFNNLIFLALDYRSVKSIIGYNQYYNINYFNFMFKRSSLTINVLLLCYSFSYSKLILNSLPKSFKFYYV